MTTTRDLFYGVAALLVAGTTDLQWNSAGTGYVTNKTTIWPKVMDAEPDRQLVITIVPFTDDPTLPIGLAMVQLKGRGIVGAPLDVDDLLDECFPLLQNLKDVTMGSVHIVQMQRKTVVPSTMDDLKRWERIDQYYLDLDYPTTALRNASGY